MPQLSATMTEGVVGKWLKQEGEPIQEGEPLYEVETDKVINEIEAPASGVLRRIIVPEGAAAPVDEVVAVIEE
jgi:pyruvate dehydrogenase E2 component (dihydrolipoamide acetyltransferase)